MTHGPNDFHGEVVDGVWSRQPGLGYDEPVATIDHQILAKQVAQIDAREETLRVKADKLAARAADLDAREAALADASKKPGK